MGMNRQQAINYLFYSGFSDEQINTREQAFKQEPTTKNDLGVDAISRAEAQTTIEMNASRYKIAKERGGMGQVEWSDQLIKVSDAVDIIRNLPSVTPQEPKIVLMAGDADKLKELVNKAVFTVIPQSKTGHWIHRENMDYLDKNKVIHNHFMCQDCGFIHDFIDGHTAQYKYCPNCGAKMVEPQESEDKR